MVEKTSVLMVGKKIKGRKRQLAVDKHGLVLAVDVKAANISDSVLGEQNIHKLAAKFPKLRSVSADAGYKVKTAQAANKHGINISIAKRICEGFKVLPRRWIVERTFSWFNHYRILSKDYCKKTLCAKTEILIAASRITMNKIIKLSSQ